MDSLLHVTAGSALFAVLNAALLGAAGRVAGALPDLVPLDRLLATLAIATLQIVAVLTACGALGILAPGPVSLLSLTVSIALALAFRRNGSLAWLGALRDGVVRALGASPLLAVVAIPTAAIGVLAFSYAATRPPLGFDSMTYHLTLAAHMMRTGDLSLFFFPRYFDLYSYLPANGDLFSVWVMLPFGCDFLLPWVNVPFVTMLGVALYRTARELAVEREGALAVAAVLSTPPVFLTVLTESYVDLPLFACFLAAVRFAFPVAHRRLEGTTILSAGLAGVAVGTKTTGLLLAALAFALHALLVLPPDRRWRAALGAIGRHAGWMVAGVLLMGAAFYVRNALVAGNPLYPVPVDLPGLGTLPGQDRYRDTLALTTLAAYTDHIFRTGMWLRAMLGETFTPYSAWGLGPIGPAALLMAPLIPFLVRFAAPRAPNPLRHRRILALAGLGLAAFVAYVFTPYSGKFLMFNVRFAYPAVALLALAGAGAMTAAGVAGTRIAQGFLLLQIGGFWFSNLPVTPRTGVLLTLAALAVPLLPWLAHALGARPAADVAPRPVWRQAITTLSALALVLAGLVALHDHRDRGRYDAWRRADEPYRLVVRHLADCWYALDTTLPKGLVAVAAEDSRNTFLFPLFGSHLQRDVAYVNAVSPDLRASHLWPEGNVRMHPDRTAWLRNLDRLDPDVLFVFRDDQDDLPVEGRWVRDMPERFEPLRQDASCAVYRVRRPAPSEQRVDEGGGGAAPDQGQDADQQQ